ncbi:MAG TPA: hypothetical protein VL294_03285 [Pseudolysinimonas sp.]|jgi:hypothetical protein|nr:hypothetical protein [Pseudolysinimonas sp.]
MSAALSDARSRPEVGALVGLGVALYGLIYAAALARNPVWMLLGLAFGGFWGAIGGSISGFATWAVLRLAASRGLGCAATIAVATACAGAGTALVTFAFLVQPLTWITVSLCTVSAIPIAVAARAVALRLQRRREAQA